MKKNVELNIVGAGQIFQIRKALFPYMTKNKDEEITIGMLLNTNNISEFEDLSPSNYLFTVSKDQIEKLGIETRVDPMEINGDELYQLGTIDVIPNNESQLKVFLEELFENAKVTNNEIYASNFGTISGNNIEKNYFKACIEIEVDDSILTDKDIDSLVSETANRINCGLEELVERLNFLRSLKINNNVIKGVFSSMREYPADKEILIPIKPELPYKDTKGISAFALGTINLGKNLYLEGPYGVGKNVFATTLAWLYKRPLYEYSINAQLSNNALMGSQTLDENGQVKFVPSTIIEAAEVGGILVLDELNMGRSNTFSFLHALLDNRRSVDVPQYKKVNAVDNFVVIATGNQGYAGTMALNQALLSRFLTIKMNHFNSIEDLLPVKLKAKDLDIFQKLYSAILKGIELDTLEPETLSIRNFRLASELIAVQALSTKDVLMQVVVENITDETCREEVKRSLGNIMVI